MYGYGASWGNGIRAFCSVVLVLVIVAVIAGVLMAGSELFDPSRAKAEADRLNAETEVIRAQVAYEEQQRRLELQSTQQQAAYEQRLREIHLQEEEQKAATRVQALNEFRAFKSKVYRVLAQVLPVVSAIALLFPAFAASYYLVRKGTVLNTGQTPAQGQADVPRARSAKSRGNAPSIQSTNISVCRPSYDGFLAFCVDFVLIDEQRPLSALSCGQPGSHRQYYPNGVSPGVASIYLAILCRIGMVALRPNSSSEWIRCRRTRDLEVISRRVPRQVFDEVVQDCFRFDAIRFEIPSTWSNDAVAESMSHAKAEPALSVA
jgi:hypothetical protein